MRFTRAAPCGRTRAVSATDRDMGLGSLGPREAQRKRRTLGTGVQAALGLRTPAPAAGARVLPRSDRARAGMAADAGVALRMERAHRHVMLADVRPDVRV